MAGVLRTYRKYWPTDAVLKGKEVLEDLMLCSFSSKQFVQGWDVTTDRRWGGKSTATVSWKPWEPLNASGGTSGRGSADDESSPAGGVGVDGGSAAGVTGALDVQPWRHFDGRPAMAAPRGLMQSEGQNSGNEDDDAPPLEKGGFFCFSGELSTEKAARAKLGGFCGTRATRRQEPLIVPNGFKVVEMRIRTDGRQYEVNFEPQSGILNDLYQGYIRTAPGQWSTVSLPLNQLLLTGQGQIRDVQRKWDKGMELRSIGFTIADGVGGPFRLDVAWISLVPQGEEDDESTVDVDGNRVRRKKPLPPKNGVMSW